MIYAKHLGRPVFVHLNRVFYMATQTEHVANLHGGKNVSHHYPYGFFALTEDLLSLSLSLLSGRSGEVYVVVFPHYFIPATIYLRYESLRDLGNCYYTDQIQRSVGATFLTSTSRDGTW